MAKHNQEDFIDLFEDRPKHSKIYCPHCKKESRDYHDSCGECGKDVGQQCGDYKGPHAPNWISHDSGDFDEPSDKKASNDRAFSTGWAVIKDQCCDNKRMVERKDGTRRCRTCGTTERD